MAKKDYYEILGVKKDERQCAKSDGFEKWNMGFIQESDLSGYEVIGRDCMVTV